MRVCASAPSSSPGGTRGQVASTSGILAVQSSSVAGKTTLVEPPEPDPKNAPNRNPYGNDRPANTNGPPGRRPVVEDFSEIMKVTGLDGALQTGVC